MLVQIRDNKKTLVSIENYNKYQTKILTGTCPGTPKGTAEGQHRDTNNNDNNIIYFNLFNKYSEQLKGKNFSEQIKIISQCRNEKEYAELTTDNQDKLFNALMSIK